MTDARSPLLPQIEHAVLAECVGINPTRAIERCIDAGLLPEHFTHRDHAALFDLLLTLYHENETTDALTVAEAAVRKGIANARTVEEYTDWLLMLSYGSVTLANIAGHARIIVNHARKRQLAKDAAQAQAEANDPALTPEQVIERQLERVLAYRPDAGHRGLRRITQRDWMDFSDPDDEKGLVFTPWPEVDRHVGGFAPGQLVILGGVAKGGKTMAVLNIARQAAMADGHPVAIFSGEMSTKETGRRLLAALAGVPVRHLKKRGALSNDEAERTTITLTRIATTKHDLFIDDGARPAITHVITQTLMLKRATPTLAAVVVDFLQLVQAGGPSHMREHEKLAYVSNALKGLAKEAEVVVFAPTQLNYKDIQRQGDREPILADLQGSSGMAQAADYVFLAHLPKPQDGAPQRFRLICDANRHGERFSVTLGWKPETGTILSLEPR